MDPNNPNNQVPTSSPLPVSDDAVKTVDFYTALQEAAAGKRITKLEWGTQNTYCLLTDGVLKIKHENKPALDNWIISDGDMAGLDWIVLA